MKKYTSPILHMTMETFWCVFNDFSVSASNAGYELSICRRSFNRVFNCHPEKDPQLSDRVSIPVKLQITTYNKQPKRPLYKGNSTPKPPKNESLCMQFVEDEESPEPTDLLVRYWAFNRINFSEYFVCGHLLTDWFSEDILEEVKRRAYFTVKIIPQK